MPIHPLPVISEEEEQKALERLKPPKTVVVRYGYMKSVAEFPYSGDQILGCGTKLIVRTRRGMEIAEMLTTTCTNSGCSSSVSRDKMLQYIHNSGGKQYPFTTDGRVLRVATVEDLNDQARLDMEKPRYIKAAKEAVKELALDMKLIEVEPLLSKDRVVFYFTSEDRVDFRELVKRLAAEMHVRIEMRQVGARDEARLVADYEKCGQHCCCKQFLKVLKPVSMRSAKVQKATLDPQKISGRCGRLMCCLRYEDETYTELRKKLPKRKSRVMTEDGPGTVINTQILTQLALVELDATRQRFAYPIEQLDRDNVPPKGETTERPRRERRERDDSRGKGRGGDSKRDEPRRPKPGKPLRDEEVESREGDNAAQVDGDQSNARDASPDRKAGGDDKPDGGKRKRRRRRRRKRGGDGDGDGGGGGQGGKSDGGGEASGSSDGDGAPKKKKRRRRRRGRGRGKKGGGDGGGDNSGGSGGGSPPSNDS